MRPCAAAIAVCLALTGTAHANQVTIDFSSLAGDAGNIVTTTFAVGPYTVFVNDCLVIDNGGVIGVLPQDVNSYDVNLQPNTTIDMDSIAMNFSVGSSSVINWNGFDLLSNTQFLWSGTAPNSFTTTFGSPVLTSTIGTETGTGNGAQLTSIVIDYRSLGAVPEPASATLAGIGILVVVALGRRITRNQ